MTSSEDIIGHVRLALGCLLHRGSYKISGILIALCVVRKHFPVVHLRIYANLIDLLLLSLRSHKGLPSARATAGACAGTPAAGRAAKR